MTKSSRIKSVESRTQPAHSSSDTKVKPGVSKRDKLRARLEGKSGASLKDLEATFGWQPHTVRAAISGLRKAGHLVEREAGSDGTLYRIISPKANA